MELLFIWILQENNIKKQGINFSPTYRFSFDFNSGQLTMLNRSADIVENFWEAKQIINLTGIVGENGVGKTTLIDLTKRILTQKLYFGEELIAIFKDLADSSIKIYSTLRKKIEANFTSNIQMFDYGRAESESSDEFRENYWYHKFQSFAPISQKEVVYYSSIVDLKDHPINTDRKDEVDVSTNFLLITDDKLTGFSDNVIEKHRFKNVERQLDFALRFEGQNFKELLTVPEEIELMAVQNYWGDTDGSNLDYSAKVLREYFYNLLINYIQHIRNTEHDNSKSPEERHRASTEILRAWFVLDLLHQYFHSWDSNHDWLDHNIGVTESEIEDISDVFDKVKFFFQKQSWLSDKGVSANNLLDEYLRLINSDFINKDLRFFSDDRKVSIPLIEAKLLLQLRQAYLSSIPSSAYKDHYPPFQLNWRNLSSGEKSVFDFLSRLNHSWDIIHEEMLEDKYKNGGRPPSLIYLILDEPEIGFHPNWQKKVIALLTSFIPLAYCLKEGATEFRPMVQVIITSHSPFIVSDLPKENVVFMKKNKHRECEVLSDLEITENTFGANIHSLISNSFFMDGLIGEFAQNKINRIIQFINNELTMPHDEAEKIIQMIGEPIIRKFLEKKLRSNMSLSKDQEISNLKARVAELEHSLKP